MGKIDRKKWQPNHRKTVPRKAILTKNKFLELVGRNSAYARIPLMLVCYLSYHRVSRGALTVLLAIGCHADSKGEGAFPSLDRLAKIVGVSKRQVQRWLKELEEEKILKRQFRHGHTTLYKINFTPPQD